MIWNHHKLSFAQLWLVQQNHSSLKPHTTKRERALGAHFRTFQTVCCSNQFRTFSEFRSSMINAARGYPAVLTFIHFYLQKQLPIVFYLPLSGKLTVIICHASCCWWKIHLDVSWSFGFPSSVCETSPLFRWWRKDPASKTEEKEKQAPSSCWRCSHFFAIFPPRPWTYLLH